MSFCVYARPASKMRMDFDVRYATLQAKWDELMRINKKLTRQLIARLKKGRGQVMTLSAALAASLRRFDRIVAPALQRLACHTEGIYRVSLARREHGGIWARVEKARRWK